MDRYIGRATLIEPHRMGIVFERGSAWCGDVPWDDSFRLLAKAKLGAGGCPI